MECGYLPEGWSVTGNVLALAVFDPVGDGALLAWPCK
jgi:hypothetical protein